MKNRLFCYCKELREILDNCKKNNPELFGSFPNAYCADASLWLCDYLISQGFDSCLFRFRSKDPFLEEGGNHVWLNYSGIDIDITADQFNKHGYNFPQVIVSDNNIRYSTYDEDWCKKEYSAHSYSLLCCLYERWGERYDIVYSKMGLKFDLSGVSFAK